MRIWFWRLENTIRQEGVFSTTSRKTISLRTYSTCEFKKMIGEQIRGENSICLCYNGFEKRHNSHTHTHTTHTHPHTHTHTSRVMYSGWHLTHKGFFILRRRCQMFHTVCIHIFRVVYIHIFGQVDTPDNSRTFRPRTPVLQRVQNCCYKKERETYFLFCLPRQLGHWNTDPKDLLHSHFQLPSNKYVVDYKSMMGGYNLISIDNLPKTISIAPP